MTFRSSQMQHYQLIIPREIAWDLTNKIGKSGLIHLEDISNPMEKPFTSQIKRCEDSLHKISFILNFMRKNKMINEKHNISLDTNYFK